MMNRFGWGEAPQKDSMRDAWFALANNPIGLSSSMYSEWDLPTGTMTLRSQNPWGTHAPQLTANGYQFVHTNPSGGFGGGAPGGQGGSSGGSGSPGGGQGLQPQQIQPIQGASGSSQGLAGLQPIGGAGAAPGYSITGASGASGAASGAAGGAGASGGSWFANAGKWAMSNQRLLTGVVTAVASAYGQYADKKAAKDMYKYQSGELAARRQYEQDRIAAYQNSPAARMSGELMKMVLTYYQQKLAKRGVNMDLATMLGFIPSQS